MQNFIVEYIYIYSPFPLPAVEWEQDLCLTVCGVDQHHTACQEAVRPSHQGAKQVPLDNLKE